MAAHAEAPAVDVTKLGMENPEVKTMLDKAMKDAMERLDSKNAEMKVTCARSVHAGTVHTAIALLASLDLPRFDGEI